MPDFVVPASARRRYPIRGVGRAGRVVFVVLGALLLCAVIAFVADRLPRLLLDRDTAATDDLDAEERLGAINDRRAVVVQVIAGLFVVVGAVTARRQVLVAREGAHATTIADAVEDLGSADPMLRMAAIYSLGTVASASTTQRRAILDVLTAFVRRNSPWPPAARSEPRGALGALRVLRRRRCARDDDDVALDELPWLRERRPDVQAALDVIARTPRAPYGSEGPIREVRWRRATADDAPRRQVLRRNLNGCDLRRAYLESANLRYASLKGSNLAGAYLYRADLRDTECSDADFTGADLREAKFARARLAGAKLVKATNADARYFKRATWG